MSQHHHDFHNNIMMHCVGSDILQGWEDVEAFFDKKLIAGRFLNVASFVFYWHKDIAVPLQSYYCDPSQISCFKHTCIVFLFKERVLNHNLWILIFIAATALVCSFVDLKLFLGIFKRCATGIHPLIQEAFNFIITRKVSRTSFLNDSW